MARPVGQRLAMRKPYRERVVRVAQSGEAFLFPPALFWVVLAMAVFGVWELPLKLYYELPSAIQLLILIACPIVAVLAAVARLRWEKGSHAKMKGNWRLLFFGLLFLLLTVLALVRAA